MDASTLRLVDAIPLLDAGLRGGAIALLALGTVVLARAPGTQASRSGASLTASAMVASLGGLPSVASLEILDPVVAICSGACMPLFWVFARSWFDDEFRVGRWEALAGIAYVLLGLFVYQEDAQPIGSLRALDVVFYAMGSTFAILALWQAWVNRRSDLVESRRRARVAFILVVGVVILWLIWSEVVGRLTGTMAAQAIAGSLIMFIGALALMLTLVGLRHADMFPARQPGVVEPGVAGALIPDPTDDPLFQVLNHLMVDGRLYRDPELTIGSIAIGVGAPEYRLRRLINGGLGHRNVNEYLNGFRLREVCEALEDPTQSETSITTIAMDAGFGSLAVFNRTFKAAVGETPSAYRRRHISTAPMTPRPE